MPPREQTVNDAICVYVSTTYGMRLAGPPSGILSDIKKSTKRKYKSSVRQLKRKQNQLKREKLAKSFAKNKKDGFWSAVKQLKRGSTSRVSVVNDCTDSSDIANIFASNICSLLNTHSPALRNSMLASTKSKLTAIMNSLECLCLKMRCMMLSLLSRTEKTDSLGLSSEHLKYACPVIAHDLSAFFTACFRHCYLPKSLRDCVINPRRACAARVTVVGSVCVSVKSHLTYGASVRPENAVTYSAGNEGQKICGVFSETAPLQRSSTPSVDGHTYSRPFFLLKARMRIIVWASPAPRPLFPRPGV